MSPVPNNAFSALIELLHDELQTVGASVEGGDAVRDSQDFAQWYVAAIQALEAHVADDNAQQPMSRREVELMCRLATTARSIDEAFALVISFTTMLHPRAGQLTLETTEHCVRLRLDSLRAQRTMASSLVDIAGLFAFKQLFHWLSQGRAQCCRVGIGAMARADLMPFLLLFGVPVLAQGEQLYLEYPLGVGELAVTASMAEFEDFFADFPCHLFASQQQPLALQISALITAAVNQALAIPNQADIARSLQIPPSSLRRKLAAGQHSFRQIREQCLQGNAEQLLLRDDMQIVDIAQRLGFKDGDTFRNAFKRWTGLAPVQWRQQQRQS
jgi:AraC-like DNA-binding protein